MIELSLPTIKSDPEQLGKILPHMTHLQRLDIQWDTDIKQLLVLVGTSLKELTVRADLNSHQRLNLADLWIRHWVMNGLVPQIVKIISQRLLHTISVG